MKALRLLTYVITSQSAALRSHGAERRKWPQFTGAAGLAAGGGARLASQSRALLRWLSLLSILLPSRAFGRTITIHIYHTNDIHGWIMARPSSYGPNELHGGAAALAAVYRADRGPKLLLDAGDWFQGTPEGTLTKGRAMADIFNAIPYDAVAVGNHDFDFDEARLEELAREIKIPVLSANIRRQKDHARVDYVLPWIIKDVAGVKIGLFGLLTTKMRYLTFPKNIEGLEFRREVDEAKDAVKALRARGATVVIAITHMGFEKNDGPSFEGDQTLASEVPGIDLIVGGHSHTALKESIKDATYGTVIVQAGSYLMAVGKVDLEVDSATGRAVSARGRLIALRTDKTGQDPQILKIVERYAQEIGHELDVVLATATRALPSDRHAESALGDWMTDCERRWAKTDLAFQNAGGIRAPMPAGPVTRRTIFNIMPFENYIVKLNMRGGLVSEALEHGVGNAPGVLQLSGLQVSYNASRPAGKRLVSASIGGKLLDDRASYSAAAVDFMVKGGDGYSAFDRAERQDATGVLLRDVLERCAKEQGVIVAPAGGRIVEVER